MDQQLSVSDFNVTSDLKQIREFAQFKATECLHYAKSTNQSHAVAWCKAKLLRYEIELPSNISAPEILISAQSDQFWFKKLKQIAAQKFEHVRRSLDLVHQTTSPYCSDEQLRNWQWQKEQSIDYMSNHCFVSASGELISMLDAYRANVSNPAIRRAELMVRIRGTEQYSKLLGHKGYFYTITAPSKYHSHYTSGKANPRYQDFNIKETNEYLCSQWCKARAQFHRENLSVYGLRVVEPHHDGTPHWHMMLFMPPEQAKRVTEILRQYAMEHDTNERGASEKRFKAVEIIDEKGSAQAYIAKYICKNIDGEFIDEDKYGNDAKDSAARIAAWSSLFNIRQFQFIGTPSVSLWRQLRKSTSPPSKELETVRTAADNSDWFAYMVLMGGHNIPKSDRPFSLEYEKHLKKHLQGLETSSLSNHAFSSKPIAIRNSSNTFAIQSKQWTLLSSPPEQINSTPAQRDGRAVDEVSGGYRRAWGGAPACGEEPQSRRSLGLV